jgi:hypothetical protein
MSDGDQDDDGGDIPVVSMFAAFVNDRLLWRELCIGAEGPWSLDLVRRILTAAYPPDPWPADYNLNDAMADFVTYLDSALKFAHPISCASCGERGQVRADAISFLVSCYRRSENDRKPSGSSTRSSTPGR